VGRSENHGWFRQFDRNGVARIVSSISARRSTLSFYAYTGEGWQASNAGEIDDARYHEVLVKGPAPDRAAAARAIACVDATV
jgi:hypothetical protein